MNCSICRIHQNTEMVLEQTEHWIVRHSELSKNCAGYFYIEPIRHVESFSDFSTEEMSELGILLKSTTQWIHKNLKPLKIYVVTISEEVKHIHFHIVPRYTSEVLGFDYLKETVKGKLKPSMEMHQKKEKVRELLNEKVDIKY